MVTPDNLGNQNDIFMLHRLILKVTKFKLPPANLWSTVVKNIFFGGGGGGGGASCPPSCEIELKLFDYFKAYRIKQIDSFFNSSNCEVPCGRFCIMLYFYMI